ncbi:MAG: hypothetical protein AAFX40_12330, partial [Cyanobacteria bacterium J06639_1]
MPGTIRSVHSHLTFPTSERSPASHPAASYTERCDTTLQPIASSDLVRHPTRSGGARDLILRRSNERERAWISTP